ncbi:hypothetical protein O1C99_001866 [Vibrio cholerae]|nr:hypothetical protein [Vibrio cholerae]EKF9801802.1 hypothetical protein [Vibrio cholerae]
MCTQKPVKPVPFLSVADRLSAALGDYAEQAAIEVKEGREFPFTCEDSAFLVRPEGRELVIVAFDGKNQLQKVAASIYRLAELVGADSLRVHTERRGELRYLQKLGYPFFLSEQRDDEFVLRCQVG